MHSSNLQFNTVQLPKMSARTCLLCGKALSRIWVGAGEDFCSREHRNQYRLRRGMDRLQEASKVASLMRRRENPKPIPSEQQAGNVDSRMADSSQIRFSSRQSSPLLPTSKWAPPVHLPESQGWVERYQPTMPEGESKAFGIPRPKGTRVILKDDTRGIAPPGENLERTKRPRLVDPEAKGGHALRVSSSAGFRVPRMQPLTHRHAAHRPAMRWPD